MAALRGERFHIPLDDTTAEDDYDAFEQNLTSSSKPDAPLSAFAALVGEITERPVTVAAPPKPPAPKSSVTGFPEHRKRTGVSRFKAQRQVVQEDRDDVDENEMSLEDRVKKEIDLENRAKVARMSEGEIAREQRELLDTLSPSLVQMFKNRAGGAATDSWDHPDKFTSTKEPRPDTESLHSAEKDNAKRVTFEDVPEDVPKQDPRYVQVEEKESTTQQLDQDLDDRLAPPSVLDYPPEISNVHFPKPVQPADLDPSDPKFFDSLHDKYFPSLPSDPSKLAWMTSTSDDNKSYDPNAESLSASQLRFGFNGELIAPRTSQSIPVTAGLHHHGEAPQSAGYTVRELAHLSRSSVPTQRCIAFQTLGRVMFRLGKGEFGDDELCKGLWRCIEEGRVLDTLQQEVDKKSGHMSAKAHAADALWLWQRGGGKRLGTG